MFKRALVSVSDKSGLIEFLQPLVKQGLKVVSTGGSAKHLRDGGIPVVDVSEQTKFPEVMGGRVKTLHPRIHMALLYREKSTGDLELLAQQGLDPFDLVICNLYPFEETLKKGVAGEELIEQIDIGGPSILRAASKNFERVTVVCDPKDYSWILQSAGDMTVDKKKQLAAKVFSHTSNYDALVAEVLGAGLKLENESFSAAGRIHLELRYGENPHQTASWFRKAGDFSGLHTAEVLQGKALSYNNLLDLEAASALVQALNQPACVIVKHNNPCGVATAKELAVSSRLALDADPVSAFGGVVALNRTVDVATAENLTKIFLECVIAPEFSPDSLSVFGKKKNLRVMRWPSLTGYQRQKMFQPIAGGILVQDIDGAVAGSFGQSEEWKYFGNSPTPEILSDLLFGERVCAALKSNAIAIIRGGQTLGLGMGQVNRVDAVQQAISRAQEHHGSLEGAVLISDAFFPFPDSIELIGKSGIAWILQPGGSLKDQDVIDRAKQLKINQFFTGKRHFKH